MKILPKNIETLQDVKDFKKCVKIYKSHKLKNGFISVTYAYLYNSTTCSTEETIEIENKGGALHSLYTYYTRGI